MNSLYVLTFVLLWNFGTSLPKSGFIPDAWNEETNKLDGFLPGYLKSSSLGYSGRIIGGVKGNISDIPYIVSLQGTWGHICGGTIVDKDIIFTAAHCVYRTGPSSLKIRAGSNYNNNGGQTRAVQDVVYHSQYSSSTMDYDFAVLRLTEPLEFGPNVQPAKLPLVSSIVAAGVDSIISGWGATREGGSVVKELQTVIVPIVNQESCYESYKNSYRITSRMICAGISKGGLDACQGDSGGPLVIDGVLVGAVSWGIGCARPGYPGVYSRVSEVRDWVDYTIARLRHSAENIRMENMY